MRSLRLMFIIVLLAGAAGGGFWWWHGHHGTPVAAHVSVAREEQRAAAIYDSIGELDFAIRDAQETQDSVPQPLVDEQNRLWDRYANLQSRIDAETFDSIQYDVPETPLILNATTLARHLPPWVWAIPAALLLLIVFLIRSRRKHHRPDEEFGNFPKPRTVRDSLTPWESGLEPPAPPAGPSAPAPFASSSAPTVMMPVLDPEAPPPVNMPPVHSRPVVQPPSFAPPPPPAHPAPSPAKPVFPQPQSSAPTAFPTPDSLPRRTLDPTFTASSWENTRTAPQASNVEPSAMQDMIISLSKRGHTPAEIARRLRLPQDQIALILKLHHLP